MWPWGEMRCGESEVAASQLLADDRSTFYDIFKEIALCII